MTHFQIMTASEWPWYLILLGMKTKTLLTYLFIDSSSLPDVCIFVCVFAFYLLSHSNQSNIILCLVQPWVRHIYLCKKKQKGDFSSEDLLCPIKSGSLRWTWKLKWRQQLFPLEAHNLVGIIGHTKWIHLRHIASSVRISGFRRPMYV